MISLTCLRISIGLTYTLLCLRNKRSFGQQRCLLSRGQHERLEILKYDKAGVASTRSTTQSTLLAFCPRLNKYDSLDEYKQDMNYSMSANKFSVHPDFVTCSGVARGGAKANSKMSEIATAWP